VKKITNSIAAAPFLKKDEIFDLDRAYTKLVKAEARDDRSGVFHPSAIGMCGRRSVYEYLGYNTENYLEEEDLEIFRMGHGVHDVVQGMLKDMETSSAIKVKFTFEAEVPCDKETDTLYLDLGIAGTCDGLITIKGGLFEQRGVVEIKSSKDELWQQLTGPKQDHRMQAHLYAFRFDAPIIWYWYYNKNNSLRKIYTETFQQDVFKEAIARVQSWHEAMDKNELPEREESWYMCKRCSYQKHCKPAMLSKKHSTKISNARKSFGGGRRVGIRPK